MIFISFKLFIYKMSSFWKKNAKFWVDVLDLVVFLILVFWIVLFIRLFIATPYTVIWSSMAPNFYQKDWIIVEKITQRFGTFERWNVIVFVAPWKTSPYIKRIIWLPWETVKFQDWEVYICSDNVPSWAVIKDSEWNNCEKLPETYLPDWLKTNATCGKDEFKVEWGYFVMWDNRWRTTDSLCCFWIECYEWANYIVRDMDLIGKVRVRLYPRFTKF
jgi:signal peptidase I